MKEETQRALVALSKKALAFVGANSGDRDLVFNLRDIIRAAEKEMKDESNEIRIPADELH